MWLDACVFFSLMLSQVVMNDFTSLPNSEPYSWQSTVLGIVHHYNTGDGSDKSDKTTHTLG